MSDNVTYRPLVKAGTFLGIGMGGLFDGIVFHQLLQVHNMLSARLAKTSITNMEVNMFWDGLFHAFTWIMTAIGLVLFWKAGKRNDVPWSSRAFVGSLFLGWGLFNFVEGLIDHHILGIHHVVESLGPSIYDVLFLLSGLVFIVGGWLAIQSETRKDVVFHPLPAKAQHAKGTT